MNEENHDLTAIDAPEPESGTEPEPEPGSEKARAPWRSDAAQLIDRLARRLAPKDKHAGLDRGDVAELRRLDPSQGVASTCAPFWRLVVDELEPSGLLQSEDTQGEAALAPWIAIFQGLAEAAGLHSPKMPLGRAMAEAKISEARLTRLLRADGQALLDAVRPLAHQLKSQGQVADWGEVADLVLSPGTARGEKLRRHVARRFYRAESQAKSDSSKTDQQKTGAARA